MSGDVQKVTPFGMGRSVGRIERRWQIIADGGFDHSGIDCSVMREHASHYKAGLVIDEREELSWTVIKSVYLIDPIRSEKLEIFADNYSKGVI